MSPIQQMLLGVGAKDDPVYIDDCFYTHFYTGDGSSSGQNITGSDFEPDLVWIKGRNHTGNHILVDSARGNNKVIYSNTNDDEDTNEDYVNSRFVGGFKVGNSGVTNGANETNVGWTWKKTPGFFDVVKFTETTTSDFDVSHSLGCVPGMILLKRLDAAQEWFVYHKSTPSNLLRLNTTAAQQSMGGTWIPTTSSAFTFKPGGIGYGVGTEWVAYVFAGGESTAATARSVDFDGSSDLLSINYSSDFYVSTNWTAEGWFKCDSLSGSSDFIFGNFMDGSDWGFMFNSTDLRFYYNASNYKSLGNVPLGQWHHIAVSKAGSDTRVFLNGIQIGPAWDIGSRTSGTKFTVAGYTNNVGTVVKPFNGKVSNIRIVKGTTLYTTSFRPPTEPLTNITNTKLLICNNSSTTGSTVTPGTITAVGSPTASTNSPFDDPAGFVFGDAGDQNVIKTGSYTGSGSAGLEVNLGFEPQWVMWKRTNGTSNWYMVDSMRGIVTGGNDPYLAANENSAEGGGYNPIEVTPTGFKLTTTGSWVNDSGDNYIFMAIRRPDGYVGKPPELGTDVFAMDTGAGSSTIPNYDSGFPVDFGLKKAPDVSDSSWIAGSRLIGTNYLLTNSSAYETTLSGNTWDSNLGWMADSSQGSTHMAWMWKRHAGFDVVAYKGNGNVAGGQIAHSLNAVPEMIIIKNRDETRNWPVYHKGLNGGTDPADHYIYLNGTGAESNDAGFWNDTMPTSTHFTLGTYGEVSNAQEYIALLFASVDGISKVGSYTGNTSGTVVTTGFQPRFILYKKASSGGWWGLLDTVRGMTAGSNDCALALNSSSAEYCGENPITAISSSGFTIGTSTASATDETYIYYAHA